MKGHSGHLQKGCTVEEVCFCGAFMLKGCLSEVVYVSGVGKCGATYVCAY